MKYPVRATSFGVPIFAVCGNGYVKLVDNDGEPVCTVEMDYKECGMERKAAIERLEARAKELAHIINMGIFTLAPVWTDEVSITAETHENDEGDNHGNGT